MSHPTYLYPSITFVSVQIDIYCLFLLLGLLLLLYLSVTARCVLFVELGGHVLALCDPRAQGFVVSHSNGFIIECRSFYFIIVYLLEVLLFISY